MSSFCVTTLRFYTLTHVLPNPPYRLLFMERIIDSQDVS